MAGSDDHYDVLRKMDREFELSKAALMTRFLLEQEELNLRLKRIGLVGGDKVDIDNIDGQSEGSCINWNQVTKRREGVPRPRTASGYRSRRSKLGNITDINAIIINNGNDDMFGDHDDYIIESMAPKVTRAGRRSRPNTSCGFREKLTVASSDSESDVSHASLLSIVDEEENLNVENIDESPDDTHSYERYHQMNDVITAREDYRSSGQSYYSQSLDGDLYTIAARGKDTQFVGISNTSSLYATSGAGAICHDQFDMSMQPRPSSLHKRKVKNIDAAAAATCSNSNKTSIPADNKQPPAAKLGFSNAARIECDANLYKKLRNKSAPGLRHPDGHRTRKPISVYHLPPLDKTVVVSERRGARSTTPATAATFHSPSSYIEANALQ